MHKWLISMILAAFLAPIARGQDVILHIDPGASAPRAGRQAGSDPGAAQPQVTITQGNITVSIYIDSGSASLPAPPPPPPAPTGQEATDADFAGASRMYIRTIPLGYRQVAGKVNKDIKTIAELSDELNAARNRASNGLARRLSARWAGCFDPAGNITNPQPIIDSLNQAAAAMEAGLK